MTDPKTPEVKLDLAQVEAAAARDEGLSFPRTFLSDLIEKGLGYLYSVVNWTWLILMLIIVGTVAMRHFIGGNTVWAEETQWHLYAVGFMVGISAAIVADAHVRVDVLAAQFRPKLRAWIELLMIVLIIFPLCWLIIYYGYAFTERSFRLNERSSNVGGLTNRWMIKGVIVLAFGLIALASFARLLRVMAFLFHFPRPIQDR